MENTLENKAKFFAQYWGQKILNPNYEDFIFPHNINNQIFEALYVQGSFVNSFLELKPLSMISDEELYNIAKHYMYSAYNVKLKEDQIHFDFIHGDLWSSGAIQILSDYSLDFLRSKGYALEWMGLSVEKMVEYKWIKLKTQE